MVLANINIQSHIHHTRIESSTKLFHGYYGYFYFLPENLLQDLYGLDKSVENLAWCTQDGLKEQFNQTLMLLNQKESAQWTLVQKSQLVSTSPNSVVERDSSAEHACKLVLWWTPPPVDPIEMYKPDLLMLRMMSASKSSAAGVSQMLDQCKSQMGDHSDQFCHQIQLIEGDMGTFSEF